MINNINNHFSGESKILVWIIVAPLVTGVLIAIVYPYISNNFTIDECLDNGGSFDYEACECDYTDSHEFKVNHECK